MPTHFHPMFLRIQSWVQEKVPKGVVTMPRTLLSLPSGMLGCIVEWRYAVQSVAYIEQHDAVLPWYISHFVAKAGIESWLVHLTHPNQAYTAARISFVLRP